MVAVLVIVGVVLYLALGAYLWYRTWTGFLRALDERYPRLPRSAWERRDTYITAGCAIFWPIMVPLVVMKTIWKFPIAITDEQTVAMPANARILSAGWQAGQLVIWAEVHTTLELEARTIRVVGTGNPIPADWLSKFIDTVQEPDRPLVWHVFEAW